MRLQQRVISTTYETEWLSRGLIVATGLLFLALAFALPRPTSAAAQLQLTKLTTQPQAAVIKKVIPH